MNIFLGGVHGVGKSFFAAQVPAGFGIVHKSASGLIKEERAKPNWGTDKRVEGAAGNQLLLAAAVKKKNDEGVRLILDGHFVLKGRDGEPIYLGADVFSALNLRAVVLLEADPQVIAQRLCERDAREESVEELRRFIDAEHRQAQMVCETLNIPLTILHSPNLDEFLSAVTPG